MRVRIPRAGITSQEKHDETVAWERSSTGCLIEALEAGDAVWLAEAWCKHDELLDGALFEDRVVGIGLLVTDLDSLVF